MWRIKFHLPFIILVSIIAFYIGQYVEPHKHSKLIKYDEPIEWKARIVYDYLNTKFELPDFENFIMDMLNIENKKNLLSNLNEAKINFTPPLGFSDKFRKQDNTIENFDKYLFYGEVPYTTFNYYTFWAMLIIFCLFPLLLIEMTRLIYLSFSIGRFSDSYVSLSARKIQLKYRLAKIEKKKSIEELEKKLSDTNTSK